MILDEVFWKLRVSFDGMLTRKKVFPESSRRIERYIDVVLEVIEVHSIVSYEFCLDMEFIEFCWYDIMFQIPHATNFRILSTAQWWSPPVSRYCSGRVQRL